MPEATVLDGRVPTPVDGLTAALARLSDADKVRLLDIARSFVFATGLDADDLFQEAIERVLDGTRHCPQDVEFKAFLIGAMRSIASAARKARIRLRVTAAKINDLEVRQDDVTATDTEESLIRSETDACLKHEVEAIFDLFRGDDHAQLVLLGDMDGLTADEIREVNGMDKTALATVRRRIRRGIQKAYPGGRAR